MKSGDNYTTLKPVMGINLLDFDLFAGDKAHWHFRLLDPERPKVRLELLQLHILELRKLDRQRERSTDTLVDWVTWFKHWREDTVMSEIRYPPVQKALDQLKNLSNDEETRWGAWPGSGLCTMRPAFWPLLGGKDSTKYSPGC
ncbi:MAG: Rpn family recombination-promoting nuclease/putative transposase [Anaerolineaceae bacterium]|nr:Rpn family recombination-promoting nuclease/putative transposase [Anaerolineaceae bacterium]